MKAFLNLILSILNSLFKIKASGKEHEEKVFEAKNTPEYKEKVQKQDEVSRRDENEKLVASVDTNKDAALDEIRKRLGQ